MPLRFDMSWRSVTAPLGAGSSGRWREIGASRSSVPMSARRSTVTAVIHFVIEPTRKRVSLVMGCFSSRSARPLACTASVAPACLRTATTPL